MSLSFLWLLPLLAYASVGPSSPRALASNALATDVLWTPARAPIDDVDASSASSIARHGPSRLR
jgi:hypothetical protein